MPSPSALVRALIALVTTETPPGQAATHATLELVGRALEGDLEAAGVLVAEGLTEAPIVSSCPVAGLTRPAARLAVLRARRAATAPATERAYREALGELARVYADAGFSDAAAEVEAFDELERALRRHASPDDSAEVEARAA